MSRTDCILHVYAERFLSKQALVCEISHAETYGDGFRHTRVTSDDSKRAVLAMGALRLRAIPLQRGTTDGPVYGFSWQSPRINLSDATLYDAEQVVRAAARVSKRREALREAEGYPADFAGEVSLLARALGIKLIDCNALVSPGRFRLLPIAQAVSIVRRWIDEHTETERAAAE